MSAASQTSFSQASLALARFGIGAKPGEIEAVSNGPRRWLLNQIDPAAAMMPQGTLLTGSEAVDAFIKRREARKASEDVQNAIRRSMRTGLFKEIIARTRHAQSTNSGFAERWVDFWANHFTVAATRPETIAFAGPFVRDAIRPHVFGSFEDLLRASTFHPGMLSYLDNHRSVGPSTPFAKRRGRGLNENLAREVLELHTLGVNGGYTQDDIIALAKALTGWLPTFMPQVRSAAKGQVVVFIDAVHEPGSQSFLGKSYPDTGPDQAIDMLASLAVHPSSARHIAQKLAAHFIADVPPASAVEALCSSFEDTGGDLAALARTLVGLEEAWSPALVKVKTPQELLISAARVLGMEPVFGNARDVYSAFAQTPFSAPSPAGWADQADAWMSPDAIKKRLEWANGVAQRSSMSAQGFARISLGALLSSDILRAINRAESRAQGLTLALMSPAFQRR